MRFDGDSQENFAHYSRMLNGCLFDILRIQKKKKRSLYWDWDSFHSMSGSLLVLWYRCKTVWVSKNDGEKMGVYCLIESLDILVYFSKSSLKFKYLKIYENWSKNS